MDDVVSELQTEGYNIYSVSSDGNIITGITLDKNSLSMSKNDTATITVSYTSESDTTNSDITEYYAIVKEKYYLISKTDTGISISRTATELDNSSNSSNSTTLTATSNNSYITVGEISGNTITLNGGSDIGSSTITVSYGEYTKTCIANVLVTPTDSIVASETTPTFSTDYGLIDVIWLEGSSNTPTTEPNEPDLYTSLGETKKLTPVTWTKYENGKEDENGEIIVDDAGNTVNWFEDETAKSTWYSYTADSGSDGKTDNTTSMWANAKNSDGSYFVWIPRYAYRITYYSDPSYTNVTGCYDGYGLYNAIDGTLNYELDDGIETVEYNGNKYIVHPAFCTNCDAGGGFGTKTTDSDGNILTDGITGFWVAKYEMSRTGATASSSGSGYSNIKFLSVPNVQSARSITIGNMYTVSLSYDSDKESHMMKNSEWGAVAYLTQSQYGRNGHEIDINNSSAYITGNGGGAVGGSVSYASGTTNAYNTIKGAKASTTGNIYGIYDMSGGAWEYVACFDSGSSSSNMSNGSSFASTNGTSTKYATAYSNGTSEYSSLSIIYSVGLIGDATKEVRQTTNSKNWFLDLSMVVSSGYPFLGRGGNYGNVSGAGVFYANCANGTGYVSVSFRAVLCR